MFAHDMAPPIEPAFFYYIRPDIGIQARVSACSLLLTPRHPAAAPSCREFKHFTEINSLHKTGKNPYNERRKEYP